MTMPKLMIEGALRHLSKGTGGELTDVKSIPFTASNGYSSAYHRYVSHVDWTKPVGLMFWFHGDGGYEYKNPGDSYYLSGDDGVIAKARSSNSILIVPATPDDAAGRWTWWAWGSKTANPQYAAELFQYIVSKYNVDLHRVWLCGFSGGAEFLSLYLLRFWGESMGIKGGGCLMIGGGTPPQTTTSFTASYMSHWVWEWRVGALDTGKNADGTQAGDGFDAVTAARNGEAWYRERGWKTLLEIIPDKGHLMKAFYGTIVQSSLTANPPARGMVTPRRAYAGGKELKALVMAGETIWEKD